MNNSVTKAKGIVLVLLVGCAVIPVFLLSDYRLGVLALVSIYALASLAQNLLSGYADIPSLGNVVFFGVSAYVAGGLMALQGVTPALALPIGVVAAGLAGAVIGVPALRVSGMHLAVVSVTMVFVAQELAQQWESGHAPEGLRIAHPQWLLQERGLYIAAVAVVTCGYAFVWSMLHSRSGRALLATSQNQFAATALGVNTTGYRLLAFVLSGLLTGIAGVLYMYNSATVLHGAYTLELSLAFLTMAILGGNGTLGGSLLGAAIIGLLPYGLQLFPTEVAHINLQQSANGIFAVLLLLALRVFPDGLWRILDRRERVETGASTVAGGNGRSEH